jgi:hypothetical protein
MKILITRAITPPNLLGIERRIAYANKKYHSGWIWTGVVIGLAGLKFSGSPKIQGDFIIKNKNKVKITAGANKSFHEYNGWNIVFSKLDFNPRGFDDPLSCNVIIWIKVTVLRIKGIRKWREKNRFKVLFLTENPPQSHLTISSPKNGIAERRLVMTVAPQNDICPHGRTYPKKAVPIKINNIMIPVDHVSFFLKEENIIPRLICV